LQADRVASRQSILAVLLIAVAIMIGGGGSPAPLPELALQLIILAGLAVWAAIGPAPLPQADRQAWLIAGLCAALPAVQLIPLPPALWQSLPGRESERAALALVGADATWRPWSVAPARTLASLLAILAPAVMLVITASLSRSGRAMMVAAIAGMGVLTLLVGAAQMSGGDGSALRFYLPDMSYLAGFQANHNSTADVLLIAMVMFAAAVKDWQPRRHRGMPHVGPLASSTYRLGVAVAANILFSIGVFLTASRAGVFLLPLAWAAVAIILRGWLRFSRRTWALLCAAAIGSAVMVAIALVTSGVAASVLSRYSFASEFRPQLWRDALYAIGQYFPWGSGVGTFVPVFIAAERLEVVDPSVPNRAHNDFLELTLEGGVIGAVILAIIGSLLLRRVWASLRQPPAASLPQVQAGAAALVILAMHSQVDYPLRSMSLACIAAVAAGLLMPANRAAASNFPFD